MTATHTGITTDEFSAAVEDWITTAKHPQTGRLFTEMVYQPMLEVLAYLRANGFKNFIVSGGGVEFMRPWTERAYGIPPEQVVGSSGKLKLEVRNGKPVLFKLPEIELIDDKEGKPVGIQRQIGRRPIAAFGNSDGDLQMLQWTMAGPGARFALFVHHDDAAREFAYDRTDKLQQFNKGWDEAVAKGWTVVSMKDDWKTVFPTVRARASRRELECADHTPIHAAKIRPTRHHNCGGDKPRQESATHPHLNSPHSRWPSVHTRRVAVRRLPGPPGRCPWNPACRSRRQGTSWFSIAC